MIPKSETYIENMLDVSDIPDTNDCQSEVTQFFAGSNVLVTGGSGFLGILLIEKLLRSCSDIRNIYIFMRAKKGKSPEERFKEHFDNVIYDKVRKEHSNFSDKVIMIEADLSKSNLGLSLENRRRLLETNVIFHMAATVRFTEPIRGAVNINVKSTKQLFLFAKEMPNCKAFIYVSTAFSHCIHKLIEEKYYPPPMETDKILTLLDILDDEKLDKMTPILLGKWPNTYVYTKAIAEDTVRQYSVGIPTCIVRPSVVTSTAKEPLVGWVSNLYGVIGIIIGSATGLLRTIYCVPENVAEIVPADYVIANIIVAAWNTAEKRNISLSIEKANPDVPEIERVPIYNYVSSCQNPITWKRFVKLNKIYGMKVPSTHVRWYYMFYLNRYLFMHNICVIFLHMMPAIIVDTLAFLSGRKPILWKIYKKINTFNAVISYFSSQQWQFRNDAVIKLWNRLNSTDRQIFNFNICDLDWNEYLQRMIPGIRIYLLKDPLEKESLDQGFAKYKKLKIAHYTIVTTLISLLIWSIIIIINYVISLF